MLGRNLPCPPCNIGPLSTPNYDELAAQAVHELGRDRKVFAGQRAEGFYVDLGAIFDLGDLRPFQNLHNQYGMSVFTQPAPGVNTTKELNVHSLALQVPIGEVTRGGYAGHDVDEPGRHDRRVDHRQPAPGPRHRGRDRRRTTRPARTRRSRGWATRCSTRSWCRWARRTSGTRCRPATTSGSPPTSRTPSCRSCCPSLYPGVFPNLAALNAAGTPRADLLAILLTGIPAGVVPGFQNFTGDTQADMLRLNVAVPPAAQAEHPRPDRRATRPASPTAAGSSTTSSPSSCGRWRA